MALPDADAIADLIASELFNDDAAARKRARATLAAHSDAGVAAYFAGDKRNYRGITDGAKLAKVLAEFDALGVSGLRVALALLRRVANDPQETMHGGASQHILEAALRYPGRSEEAFEALASSPEVYLPKTKKVLPAGLSRLRALRVLRVPEGTLTSAENLDELAEIPQPFTLQLWVKDVRLALWDAASHKVSGIGFRGAYSGLTDLAPLASWRALRMVSVEHTGVTDLAPLRELPLTSVNVSETAVSDLSPLAAMTDLVSLSLRRTKVTDLSLLARFTALESLDLSFSVISDLSVLREHRALRRLELWGTRVQSLEPLAALPLESLDLNHSVLPDLTPLLAIKTLKSLRLNGSRPDAPGLAAILAERPDIYVAR